MKILVTGFDPFENEAVNPAWEGVKLLPTRINGAEIIKLQIPTVFNDSIKVLLEGIEKFKPQAVLCIGQAGGRFDISVERIAINLNDARIKDNKGNQPIDNKIYDYGDNAYFSSLPIKSMVEYMKKENIPASISNTAGTFVCNHLMYGLLYNIDKYSVTAKGGFIHVPYIPKQVINKPNTPSMDLSLIAKGLEAAITAIIENDKDIKITGGKEF
ncbi:pyroglutamyl-peptidase I [Fusobacterium sp. MFO224]|uniref:pyroglutamyl-peptidase I n=1 Tax=Fusobacterium sp. MFO224 TaxID=3378070 RepID=UPI0038527C5D